LSFAGLLTRPSLSIKRIAYYTASLDSLTNLNWNAVAALQTGSLSCPASDAVFAGLEAVVALTTCIFFNAGAKDLPEFAHF